MSQCPKCKKSLEPDAKFCSKCGTNLKGGGASGKVKRIGMVLTILGGCLFLYPAMLAVLGFVWATVHGLGVISGVYRVIPDNYISVVAALMLLLFSSLQVIVAGGYVSSDRPSYRRQGAALALAAAGVAMTGVVLYPSMNTALEIAVAVLRLTLFNAIPIFFILFTGLVLTIIGAALGLTYRGLLEGLSV